MGCAFAVAEEIPEEVAEEASSDVDDEEASADVDVGRIAVGNAPCTPWTVNPTLMMLEARVSTCGEVTHTARRVMMMRSQTRQRMVLNCGAVEVVEGGWVV